VDSREDLRQDEPPARRGTRLPRPRLRRGDGTPPSPIDPLLKKVRSYNPKADTREIARAFAFAEAAHVGQKRKSGEDFITHPVAVTDVLADLRLDTTTLEAALLHDTVEDTRVTMQEIEEGFGADVARIVDGLTKLERLEFHSREQEQAENVRKMIVAMAGDIRVLLIKLADRLHNMRTLTVFPEPKQRRIATETLEIYAPLAHRLGVQEIKWELEDLSFKTLHPGPYREIASLVDARREERTALIEQVTREARSKLKELGVKAEIEGRPKHLYSIYEKMVLRGKEFNEIYDLVGVRILVDSLRDCYAALGAVHALWKPLPGRFKDYVAMPKSNMYQSLHTTVVGPAGTPLEIQIRTREMHRTAKFGIAAHWRYKEGGKQAKEASAEAAWLGQMMDWLKDMADPREFMDSLRIDLYGGQVFVFTPKGDVVNLPAGATPVDFAYAIHTDVGHRTIGAKVGGKLQLVNVVGLEEYLLGVVPGEMPKDWPLDALEAQAVAARTYAVANLVKGRAFDLYSDARSQVYYGADAEAPGPTRAVTETRGQVLSYDGAPAETFYFSSSGGRTLSALDAFGLDVPYLVSVDDPWDETSPNHRWQTQVLGAQELARRLGLAGAVTNVAYEAGTPGTPAAIRLTTTVGATAERRLSEVRNRLGLKSLEFRLGTLRLDRPARATGPGAVRLTGLAREVSDVVLERRTGPGAWAQVARVAPTADGTFVLRVRIAATTSYRLSAGGVAGPAVTVRVAA